MTLSEDNRLVTGSVDDTASEMSKSYSKIMLIAQVNMYIKLDVFLFQNTSTDLLALVLDFRGRPTESTFFKNTK